MDLPPAVEAPLSETVREYWLDRVRQHTEDSYLGMPALEVSRGPAGTTSISSGNRAPRS